MQLCNTPRNIQLYGHELNINITFFLTARLYFDCDNSSKGWQAFLRQKNIQISEVNERCRVPIFIFSQ